MKNNDITRSLLCISVSAALLGAGVNATAKSDRSDTGQHFGGGRAVDLDKIPAGQLKRDLDRLPATAREKARKWMEGIEFHSRDVPFMRTDRDGGVYFADTELPSPDFAPVQAGTDSPTLNSATTPVDVFKLHSQPGSSKVIYLDFTGHAITGTAWNSSATTLNAVPYDLDGAPGSFNATEQANIAEIWRRIAEDYAPFTVDVTTEEPARFGPTVGRLLITTDTDANGLPMPAQGAGGVAYIGVWGRSDYPSKYSPAFVYYNRLGGGRPDYITEAASHEMGHNLGLSHDGTATSSYYGGHGSGFISWGPIMGTGYGRNVSQWSKGEYTDANQTQDDMAIISSKVTQRPDDHGDSRTNATPLVVDASGHVLATTPANDPYASSVSNKGVIGARSDVDVFSFTTAGGSVTLQASPAREASATRGGNLDILLSLYDSNGNLLASSDPLDDTDAGVSQVLSGGTYYLSVQGTGSSNYTNYGSLGQYFIEGLLPVNTDDTPPSPNPMGWTLSPEAAGSDSIRMEAVTAVDDTSAVEYYFACTAGGNGCVDSGWGSSPAYTLRGLDADSTYSFSVKARDAWGNETNRSVAASATTEAAPEVAINLPPVLVADYGSVVRGQTVVLAVLANDLDPEGDTLTLVNVGSTRRGSATQDGSQITYVAGSRTGSDTFTYTVTDGQGNQVTSTVTVTIKRR